MFRKISNRIGLVCSLLAVLLTFFAFRLVDIQVGGHEKFLKLAVEKHGVKQPIFAQRGTIYDRHGEALAVNVPVRTVTADGTRIKNPGAVAHIAAPFLGIKESELAAKLSTKRPYVVIQNGVSELEATAMMKALEAAKLQGLYLQEGAQRVYPNGKMLCHVLGFIDHTGHGIDGVEKFFDRVLAGRNGYRHVEHDRRGVEIVLYRGQEEPAENGKNITLTIDMGLQAIVEKELDNAMATYHPSGATAIVVDPITGEVLAMASRPNYDPNHFSEATPEQMRNRAITDMYEPGSVFKIVATSGAINEGIVTENTPIFCEYGRFLYGGKILKEASHEAFGEIPVKDVLVHSSNIGAAKIALKMGDQKYYEYVRRFGFGEKTKIQLPGEISGLVNPPSRWDKLTLTRMAIGQSVAATPIQVVMAMSTIANRGKLMAPQLIRQQEGAPFAEPVVRREVVSTAVAESINSALSDVVSKRGTAIQAKVDAYTVAGKTGTAQKINPHGGYLNDRYIVSFAGYFPAENPRLATLVVVDDAHVASCANYGGLIAAPVFSKIGEASARYLDLAMSPAEQKKPKEIHREGSEGKDERQKMNP